MLVWVYTAMTMAQPLPATGADAPVSAEVGKALLTKYQCNRCHQSTGLPAVALHMDCVQCHRAIHAGTFEATPEQLKAWQQNIVDLTATPSLDGLHQRLRRDWLAAMLREPHDLRPRLSATMPRLSMDDEEVATLARYLVPRPLPEAAIAGDPAKGRALLDTRGCGLCHSMSGVAPLRLSQPKRPPPGPALSDALLLAPDLSHTRRRFQTARLEQWLRDPRSLKSDALMPKEDLTAAEARDVAAYLLTAKLAPPQPAPMPQRLPLLKRRVTYSEVATAVFGHTCVHCHADPDYAVGDGGPGNTGGFGYAPKGVNLTGYATIQAGYIADDGERHSLFAKMPDGTPRLVAALWARHSEVRGAPIPNLRGMPLGLPPLSPEHIRLVATWAAQGRPE